MTSASRIRPVWTFAIVSVALFMVVLDNLVVTTALPSIRADLGGGLEALRVDRQRLHADRSPCCCSRAPRSATASAAGGCS